MVQFPLVLFTHTDLVCGLSWHFLSKSFFSPKSHNCCFLLAAQNGAQYFPPFVLHEQIDQNTSVAQECSTCNPASQRQWLDRNHMRCVSKRHLVASLNLPQLNLLWWFSTKLTTCVIRCHHRYEWLCLFFIHQESLRLPRRRVVCESSSRSLTLQNAGRFSNHWFILFNDALVHTQVHAGICSPAAFHWYTPIV